MLYRNDFQNSQKLFLLFQSITRWRSFNPSKKTTNEISRLKKEAANRAWIMETFEDFIKYYRKFVLKESTVNERKQAIKKFVHKVELGTDSFKIHFIVDQHHYRKELALAASSLSLQNHPKNNLINSGSSTWSTCAPFDFEGAVTYKIQLWLKVDGNL